MFRAGKYLLFYTKSRPRLVVHILLTNIYVFVSFQKIWYHLNKYSLRAINLESQWLLK